MEWDATALQALRGNDVPLLRKAFELGGAAIAFTRVSAGSDSNPFAIGRARGRAARPGNACAARGVGFVYGGCAVAEASVGGGARRTLAGARGGDSLLHLAVRNSCRRDVVEAVLDGAAAAVLRAAAADAGGGLDGAPDGGEDDGLGKPRGGGGVVKPARASAADAARVVARLRNAKGETARDLDARAGTSGCTRRGGAARARARARGRRRRRRRRARRPRGRRRRRGGRRAQLEQWARAEPALSPAARRALAAARAPPRAARARAPLDAAALMRAATPADLEALGVRGLSAGERARVLRALAALRARRPDGKADIAPRFVREFAGERARRAWASIRWTLPPQYRLTEVDIAGNIAEGDAATATRAAKDPCACARVRTRPTRAGGTQQAPPERRRSREPVFPLPARRRRSTAPQRRPLRRRGRRFLPEEDGVALVPPRPRPVKQRVRERARVRRAARPRAEERDDEAVAVAEGGERRERARVVMTHRPMRPSQKRLRRRAATPCVRVGACGRAR